MRSGGRSLNYASTCPGGPLTAECYAQLKTELLDRLRASTPVDGVLLPLHGAATVEGLGDPEGDLIKQCVRSLGRRYQLSSRSIYTRMSPPTWSVSPMGSLHGKPIPTATPSPPANVGLDCSGIFYRDTAVQPWRWQRYQLLPVRLMVRPKAMTLSPKLCVLPKHLKVVMMSYPLVFSWSILLGSAGHGQRCIGDYR